MEPMNPLQRARLENLRDNLSGNPDVLTHQILAFKIHVAAEILTTVLEDDERDRASSLKLASRP